MTGAAGSMAGVGSRSRGDRGCRGKVLSPKVPLDVLLFHVYSPIACLPFSESYFDFSPFAHRWYRIRQKFLRRVCFALVASGNVARIKLKMVRRRYETTEYTFVVAPV